MIQMAKRNSGARGKKPEPKEPKKNLNVQIDPRLKDELDAVSDLSGVNLNVLVARALALYLPRARRRAEDEAKEDMPPDDL